VLIVPGIQEGDQDICIEHYSRHSSRSWLRCSRG
jgi:hypothetical protein